ncbi:uncharacterized protein FA14DRAFT_157167 [Meira miltonrushii]|uniref:Uncharacterized protein n=1 Tax=Meira miltonrushii TaxID=1280837 RepID=A0A316V5Z4_9BASI|nr:uncharacterized protein FA14DRAFT_157167 [Meira miltonrushii]PWN32448.1 hypothetical protein FA14DRAFT_157167 [Meira miltonrushii]
MVILERTPPRKWQAEGSDQEEVNNRNGFAGGFNNGASAQPRKSYVFPSLEDMAAPIREQRAAKQANGHQSASSSASAASPGTVKQVPHTGTSLRQASPSQAQRQQPSKIPVNRTMRSSGSPQKKSVSPFAIKKNVDESSASKRTGGSPSRMAQSSREAAVDAAFQEQIERAIASGEDPFKDKRRAVMRDDSNASVTTTPNTLYPPLPPKRSSIARQSDSHTLHALESSTKGSAIPEIQEGKKTIDDENEKAQVPRRSQEEVQRAATTIRKSLLSEEGQNAPATLPTQQQTFAVDNRSARPASPPLETFTPQRRRLTREAHAIPIIQQEELHRLRSDLRECKALLRDSQLETERLQQECQDNRAEYDDEKRKNQTIEAQLKHLELVALEHECMLKETQWEITQNDLRVAVERDEQMRKKGIEIVLAKNKITRLRARALDAESSLDKLKSKQGKHDDKVHQEKAELEEEVERLRSERQDLNVHLKEVEEKYREYKEQVDSHADQMEALENAVATEKARRKEISSREAALRGEVQELQKVAAREAKLRAELAEVRADLSSERMAVSELRKQTHRTKLSASPSRNVVAHSPLRNISSKDSRNAMTPEAEFSFDRSLNVEAAPSPPPKQTSRATKQSRPEPVRTKEIKQTKSAKSTAKAKEAEMSEDEESQDEVERMQSPVRKTRSVAARPKAQPASRAKARKKEVEVVENEESEPESPVQEQIPPSPVATEKKAPVEKKRTTTKKAVEFTEKVDAIEVPQQDVVPSFLPTMKTTKRSILNKGRIAPPKAKTVLVGTSSRSQIQSDAGDSSGASKSNKSKETIAPPISVHDETMQTPLLPSKRARAVQNRQAEVEEDDEVDISVQANKAQKATSKLKSMSTKLAPPPEDVGNVSNGGATRTPMVQKTTAAEPRKKKRKLLKAGANVAGDFLNWKGDADGALNPELNLPMELSPLKQGEEQRPGSGLNMTSGGAQKVFGRRK